MLPFSTEDGRKKSRKYLIPPSGAASSSKATSHCSRQRNDPQPDSALPSECGLAAENSDLYIGGLAKVRGGTTASYFSNPWMVILLTPREVMLRQNVQLPALIPETFSVDSRIGISMFFYFLLLQLEWAGKNYWLSFRILWVWVSFGIKIRPSHWIIALKYMYKTLFLNIQNLCIFLSWKVLAIIFFPARYVHFLITRVLLVPTDCHRSLKSLCLVKKSRWDRGMNVRARARVRMCMCVRVWARVCVRTLLCVPMCKNNLPY